VVDDKWLAALAAAIHGEMDRVSQQLTQRVKELAERYEIPMPQMAGRVAELEGRVNGHLERMGFFVSGEWRVESEGHLTTFNSQFSTTEGIQADRGGGDPRGLGGKATGPIDLVA